jgi:uncharacterized protein
MPENPIFPHFKPLGIEDRAVFAEILKAYGPETSEWTFTNLFIWRSHYGFEWSIYKDQLLLICTEGEDNFYAMQPIGPPPRRDAVLTLLQWLREEKGVADPRIEKADRRLVVELSGSGRFHIEPTRDHFDYVYLRKDLVELGGNKYRAKRNHINKFLRLYPLEYTQLGPEHLDDCLALQEKWCLLRRCEDDLNLLGEWEAIREILAHFDTLELRGGVLLIGGKVHAFAIGERLDAETAVIHIEKADPEIAELYAVINQQCSENCWQDVQFINREQDLGLPGLREAKLSYNPHHFAEKWRITLM